MQNNRVRLVISTTRLILREFVPTDWEAVSSFLSDPDVTRYMHFSHYSRSDLRDWFDWCIENSQREQHAAYNWAITLRATEHPIGWLGIGVPSKPADAGERDFGFALDKRYWGRGYMTEALRAILAFEFGSMGSKRIYATCETDNVASARVMERVGMQYEGTFRDADFMGNVAYRHRYGIHHDHFDADGGERSVVEDAAT